MKLRRRLAQGAAWSAASTWTRISISFATFVALAKLLGPEVLGLGAMITSVVTLAEVFLGIGILESIVQRRDLEPAHASSMFWLAQGVALAFAGLAIATAPAVAAYYREPILAELIPWAMLAPYLTATAGVPDALLRRELRFRPLALASVSSEVGGSVVGLAMALAGYGVWSLVGLLVANAAVRTALVWGASRWLPRGRPSRRHLRDLMGFNASIVASRFFVYLERALPALIVGPALGSAALGTFSIARRFVQLVAELVMNPLQAVALPAFAHLGDETARIRELLLTTTRLTGATALPVFAGIALTAPDFVPAFLGPRWDGAVLPLQILCLYGVRLASSSFNHSLIRGMGQPQLHTAITAVSAGMTALAMLAVVRRGTAAVALAVVFAGYAAWPLGAWAVQRLAGIGLRSQLAPFAAPAAAVLCMAAAVLVWRQLVPLSDSVAWRLASTVAIGVASYGLAMLCLAADTLREAVRIAGELRGAS